MRKLLDATLDLIFPPRCEVCGQNSKETLCFECFKQIKFMKPYLGVHSVAVYEECIKTAIHRFKFKQRKKLADPLGLLLVKYLSHTETLRIEEIDAIVPVPLHKNRHNERGFNQAELLGQVVQKYFGTPVVPALERVKDTHAQFDLPRHERFENIQKAFKVSAPKEVYEKRLLLLDDIYTTGATIAECAKTLKIAGAKRVEILTLSRAVEV